MKKCLSILLTEMLLIFAFSLYVYASEDITVLVNNQPVISEQKPIILDGNTYVPLRSVAEAMGCEVVWVQGSKTANIKNLTTIAAFQVDNPKITKMKRTDIANPVIVESKTPPKNINGSVYLPLIAMAETFGAKVGWDAVTRTVMIMYDTTVKYTTNMTIERYAGNGARKRYDDSVNKMEFLSPESIDVADDGSIYISDTGTIRKITDGKSSTVEFEPSYITANKIRCYGDSVYFTTNAFEDETGEKFYGIVKLENGVADGIYITNAVYSRIDDFDIDNKGNIYAIIYNAGYSKNYIAKFNGNDDMEYLKEIDDGFHCMTIDDNGDIFLGNSVKGSIYRYIVSSKELKLFAGVDDNTNFVDGTDPMFYEPRSMVYKNNTLYVMDYNLLRKITMNNGKVAISSETMAGKISTELKPNTKEGKAADAEIAPSNLMEIAVTNEGILITDPVNDKVFLVR